jgi:hypothetical protein
MGDIDLKVIFAAENSNKFQKTRFCKEKSVEFPYFVMGSHLSQCHMPH